LAAITGLEQRAGAAIFQASLETVSGVAGRAQHDHPHAGVLVEQLEGKAELLALRHRHHVERRAVEDYVRALVRLVDLDAKAVGRFQAEVLEDDNRTHAAVPCERGAFFSVWYSPATSRRRKSLPTGDFGIASTNT
jgi:hypothetical protein